MQFFHTPIDSSSSQLSIGSGFIITAVIDRPVERMNGPHLRSDGPRAHNFSRSFSPAVISFASHVIDILIAWKRYPQRALPNELSPVPIRPYSEEPDLSKAHGSWNCFVQTWNFLELHQLFLTAVGRKKHMASGKLTKISKLVSNGAKMESVWMETSKEARDSRVRRMCELAAIVAMENLCDVNEWIDH